MEELGGNVDGRYDAGSGDGAAHAQFRQADEFIDNGQHDDDNGHGIDEQQKGQRDLDDLVQAEIGQEQADDADDGDVFLIRQDRKFFGEERRNSGDEADCRRKAGQRDHDGQEGHADSPENLERRLRQDIGAEIDRSIFIDRLGDGKMIAQQGQAQIKSAHEDGYGSPGHPDTGDMFLF